MDARANRLLDRTRRAFDGGVPIDDLLRELREAGYGFSESIGALVKARDMTPAAACAVAADSVVWGDIQEAAQVAPKGRGFRIEWIDPPDPPDERMLESMRQTFEAQPRLAEAYLVGEHLIPEDGSRPFDSTRVVLVFESEDRRARKPTRRDLDALMGALSPLDWSDAPRRDWGFVFPPEAAKRSRRSYWGRKGELIYSRERTGA